MPGVAGIYEKHFDIIFISRLLCTPVTENDWGSLETRQPGYKNNIKMFYIPAVVFPGHP